MTPVLRRRTGFEIELLAPRGRSRLTLAEALAAGCGGRVTPVWHHDSEPSLVPGLGRFLHLTRGFAVHRPDGTELCTLVDDVTLRADLNAGAAPPPGWFRILSDDPRLLSLLARHTDPAVTAAQALDAAAALWGVPVRRHGGVLALTDPSGATIALSAPQGGERERPCEIVTPPVTAGHRTVLEELLGPARSLGFTVAREAAVHLHVDAGPFRNAHAAANLVRLFGAWREPLRVLLGTNPHCRRLAPLPDELRAAVAGEPTFAELRTAAAELTKYFDVNLTQLFAEAPARDTVEIRTLPGSLAADDIVHRAALIELLLDRCESVEPLPAPPADPARAVDALMAVAASSLA